MTDNTGATCVRCGKGHYKALDLNDAIFGDLHCDNCGHYVKFNQDLGKCLSPQAQAVLDAYNAGFNCPVAVHHKPRIAAALRAAADQVVPALDPDDPGPVLIDAERNRARRQLLAIAAELEGVTSQ